MSTPLSVNVNSIGAVNQSTTAPATVSASLNADGTSVDPTTSTASGGAADSLVTATSNSQMNDQDFLQLFVAEMQNQDPTSPMDDSQMMTQMAQLQSLESSTNMQKAIDDLSASYKTSLSAQQNVVTSMTNATAVSLIGKEVRVQQKDLTYSGIADGNDQIRVNLGNNSSADVQILDSKGTLVKTLHTGDKDSRNSALAAWDGTTDAGGYAGAGTYKINVVDSDKDPSLYAFVNNVVQGVSFSSTGASLEVDGKEMSVADVMNVAAEDAASSVGSISASTAIGLIGKTVRVLESSVTYGAKNGESHQIKVNANVSAPVSISILDDQGNVIDTMNAIADANGTASFSWSGQTTNGGYAPSGTYIVQVRGQDKNPSLYAFDEGIVDGVNTLNGVTQLRMNGQTVPLSAIIDISSKTAG
jgi:flagellar basal-body rod modification protein FlgD